MIWLGQEQFDISEFTPAPTADMMVVPVFRWTCEQNMCFGLVVLWDLLMASVSSWCSSSSATTSSHSLSCSSSSTWCPSSNVTSSTACATASSWVSLWHRGKTHRLRPLAFVLSDFHALFGDALSVEISLTCSMVSTGKSTPHQSCLCCPSWGLEWFDSGFVALSSPFDIVQEVVVHSQAE